VTQTVPILPKRGTVPNFHAPTAPGTVPGLTERKAVSAPTTRGTVPNFHAPTEPGTLPSLTEPETVPSLTNRGAVPSVPAPTKRGAVSGFRALTKRGTVAVMLSLACGSRSVPPPTTSPDEVCEVDADCVFVPLGCCSCSSGGGNAVRNRRAAANQPRPDCADTTCPKVIRETPECRGEPACRSGRCVAVPVEEEVP